MSVRLFKTKRFAVLAGKAWIGDDELREAFSETINGQADNLGGGGMEEAFEYQSPSLDCPG